MATLLLKFTIELRNYEHQVLNQFQGPVFHRWLPDGRNNALDIPTGVVDTQLRVWFERRGFVRGGFIDYDRQKKEVDPDIMARQGLLQAGPIHGSLEMRNLSEDQLEPLIQNKIGDARYVELGRLVVQNILYPCLSRVISTLRVNYGQYWLSELPSWDSRRESLGYYCAERLNMEWTLPGGSHWAWFVPDEL